MNNKNMPAFPQVWDSAMGVDPAATPPGLTKREYFAVLIAQGMHASTPGCISQSVVNFAIKEADTLLKELET